VVVVGGATVTVVVVAVLAGSAVVVGSEVVVVVGAAVVVVTGASVVVVAGARVVDVAGAEVVAGSAVVVVLAGSAAQLPALQTWDSGQLHWIEPPQKSGNSPQRPGKLAQVTRSQQPVIVQVFDSVQQNVPIAELQRLSGAHVVVVDVAGSAVVVVPGNCVVVVVGAAVVVVGSPVVVVAGHGPSWQALPQQCGVKTGQSLSMQQSSHVAWSPAKQHTCPSGQQTPEQHRPPCASVQGSSCSDTQMPSRHW
jgi:hypothetical protein